MDIYFPLKCIIYSHCIHLGFLIRPIFEFHWTYALQWWDRSWPRRVFRYSQNYTMLVFNEETAEKYLKLIHIYYYLFTQKYIRIYLNSYYLWSLSLYFTLFVISIIMDINIKSIKKMNECSLKLKNFYIHFYIYIVCVVWSNWLVIRVTIK